MQWEDKLASLCEVPAHSRQQFVSVPYMLTMHCSWKKASLHHVACNLASSVSPLALHWLQLSVPVSERSLENTLGTVSSSFLVLVNCSKTFIEITTSQRRLCEISWTAIPALKFIFTLYPIQFRDQCERRRFFMSFLNSVCSQNSLHHLDKLIILKD